MKAIKHEQMTSSLIPLRSLVRYLLLDNETNNTENTQQLITLTAQTNSRQRVCCGRSMTTTM